MGLGIINRIKNNIFHGDYVGRDQNITNIIMFQDSEREFVVTHNANIKPVSYFTGRETELQDLRQRIEEGRKSVLVSGMGGIGKTQICRKLFNEYNIKNGRGKNGPFSHIGYIEYDGDMNSSLQNCLMFRKQDSPEKNLEAAWQELEHLAADGKLLLFVDNVNVPIRQDAGLGRLKQLPGAVVLTSRRTSFSKEFELCRIGFLDTEQCVEIYERIRYEDSGIKVPEKDVQDLKYVIDVLAAGHTITIEFLAHLAEAKCWTVKELRKELEDKGFYLEYKDKEDKLINIQKEYEKLYDLSKLTEAEQNILEAFSIFPYIPLGVETCNQWLLADAGVSEDDNVLMGLYKKGWLQFDIEQGDYAMHPVFAKFIYERCKPKSEGHLGLMEGCQKCLKIPKSGSAMECQKYIPFAENIVEKISMESEIERVPLMDKVACLLRYMGEYTRAEALYKKNLQIERKLCGEGHQLTADGYNALALVLKKQGKYKEAEELYKKALLIREKVLGKEHPDTAVSYNNLAGVYESQGKYPEAEELLKKALLIKEKILGEEHESTAKSYNNLAGTYMLQEKYKEAEELHRKALLIREKVLGEEHPHTAASYNNLAWVYYKQGKYKEAEEIYKRALLVNRQILGEEHPNTATCYTNFATVYYAQGKYKKAEVLFKKNLLVRKKMLGEEHPDIANSYNNLAMLYYAQGKYKISLRYYYKAYRILVFKFGFNHPITQIIYNNMKITYFDWNPGGNFGQWLEEKTKEPNIYSVG